MTILRYLAAFLLPAMMFLLNPAPASAQWPPPRLDRRYAGDSATGPLGWKTGGPSQAG
jgi:hypothetical protein